MTRRGPVSDKNGKAVTPESPLTPRDLAFINTYMGEANFNAAEAARKVGYSEKAARINGYKLLQKPNVAAEVARRQAKMAKRFEITAERVLQEFAAIAFFDIADLFDEEGNLKKLADMPPAARKVVQGIEVTQNAAGHIVTKFKVADKKAALDSLARHLGLFKDSLDINLNVNTGNEQQLADLAREEIERKTGVRMGVPGAPRLVAGAAA